MKTQSAATLTRLAVLVLAATALAGCSTISGWFSSDKGDYRSASPQARPLEVPPDLSQLAKESRYQAQGGVVSAAAAGASAPAGASAVAAAASAPPGVVLTSQGALRVEREGQQRWLVTPEKPEQLWPKLRVFWEQRGFTLNHDNASLGIMETNWAPSQAKVPGDAVRDMLGKLLPNLFDIGQRDLFRTRVERTPAGSEIYVTHRGLEEVFTNERRENTTWRARPSDPELEAEMLSRLLVALGSTDPAARAAVSTAPQLPARASAADGTASAGAASAGQQPTSLVLDDNFDRAWRRVGLVLDRGGFTVEDRDRTAGLYYVRYIDPKSVGKEEPGWWARLWGDRSNPQAALRYRILLKGEGAKTRLSVQTSAGVADTGENARRIVALMLAELR